MNQAWRLKMVIVVVALAAAGPAVADIIDTPKILVNGGLSIPTSPERFRNAYVLGGGGGVGIEFPLAASFHAFANLDFASFALDRDGFLEAEGLPPGTPIVGGNLSIFYLALMLKYYFFPQADVRPYLVGGIGYYRGTIDDINVDGEQLTFGATSDVGGNVGGGVDFSFGPVLSVFGEIFYIVGATGDNNFGYTSLRIGLSFDLKPDV